MGDVDLTPYEMVGGLIHDENFKSLPYEEQMTQLAEVAAEAYGYTTEELAEIKLDKDWGGYLTLHSDDKGAEKLLIVRPVPGEIPSNWDWDGPYGETLQELLGSRGVALSFQRHTDGRTEVWDVVAGKGYHLFSGSAENPPSLEDIQVTPLVEDAENPTEVTHLGENWHAGANISPDTFLVLHEIISLDPHDDSTFDETNIERAHDLFKRAGINRNI